MSEADLQALRQLYADWSEGRMRGGEELFDPEVVSRSYGDWPENPDALRGKEAVVGFMADWIRTWERPLRIEAEELIEAGDKILVLIRWRGRGKGSGAEMEASGAHLWEFRDGLAIRFDVYRDRDEARAALGGSDG